MHDDYDCNTCYWWWSPGCCHHAANVEKEIREPVEYCGAYEPKGQPKQIDEYEEFQKVWN